VRENFLALRNDLWHMTCGLYLAELVDRFVEDDTKHPEVYALMLEMLRGIEEDVIDLQQRKEKGKELVGYEHARTTLLLRYFEIHLLSLIGYEPAFRHCEQY